MADRDELLRLRDRVHALSNDLAAERYARREIQRKLDELEQRVARMSFADELADAVADKVAERRAEWWTFWRRAGAVVVGLASVIVSVDAARGLWP